jgi:4'-phosphopantetheinyl transferase
MGEDLALGPQDVQLWIFELAANAAALDYFRSQLSPEEVSRADRFRFVHLRESFVIAHGVLRGLLADYLGARPDEVSFCYNEQGKPRLADVGARLRFNLSHSGALAACAFALDCDLGVDIEEIRQMTDLFDIARRFFSADECADLESTPVEEREGAFFNCWTRKEAYIKAVGGGLSIPLDSFCVSLIPGQAARLISNRENSAADWNVQAFDPGPGYRGAVAYNGPPRQFNVRRMKADEASASWHIREKLRNASH